MVEVPGISDRFSYRSRALVLEIVSGKRGITGAFFTGRPDSPDLPRGPLRDELDLYFAGSPVRFAAAIDLGSISGFRRDVLEALMRIPWGRVVTYGTLARGVGRPGAARAAGAACRSNPIGLLIPCHRVVASDGPGGYSGSDPAGISLKLSLLALEGAVPGSGGRFGPPFLLGEIPG